MAKLKNYRYYPKPGNEWNPLHRYPRNLECFCGSEIKAKKCCLPKVALYCNAKVAAELQKNWEAILAGAHRVEIIEEDPDLDKMHDEAVNEADQNRLEKE